MRRSIILILLLGFVTGTIVSQEPTTIQGTGTLQPMLMNVLTPGFTPPMYTDYADGIAKMQFSKEERHVVGTPFLEDEFLFGVLILHDGTQIDGQKYRYNVHADEMQFILRDDTVAIYQPLKVQSVTLGKQKFIYDLRKVGEDQLEAGYFEVLVEGQASLLLRRLARMEVDEYVPNYMGGGGSKNLFYKHAEFHYIKVGDKAVEKIKNRRVLLKVMGDRKSDISAFMKRNNLSVRQQDDIVEIVDYYNKL